MTEKKLHRLAFAMLITFISLLTGFGLTYFVLSISNWQFNPSLWTCEHSHATWCGAGCCISIVTLFALGIIVDISSD